jgi:beta-lactamase regulating signal transducer with metallopeptidase domain
MEFSFLDYIWRGLVVMTFISTCCLGFGLLASRVFDLKLSSRQHKWYLNWQTLSTLLFSLGSFVFVVVADPELTKKCFAQFANQSNALTTTRFLAGTWCVAVLVLLIITVIRTLKVYSSIHKAESTVDLNNLLNTVKQKMSFRRNAEINIVNSSTSPHVIGFFQYKIIIPAELVKDSDKETLTQILAHEIAHAKDFDVLCLTFSLFIQKIFFFHPLAYLLISKHRLMLEKSADESALKALNYRPQEMASTLLKMAEKYSLRPQAIQLAVSGQFQILKNRIESLYEINKRPKSTAPVYLLLIALSIAFSTIVTLSQANAINKKADQAIMMCTQLDHEQMLESWLRIEREINKCEK